MSLPKDFLPIDTTESQELYEHHRVLVDEGQTPIRIDKFLMDRMPHISRTRLQLTIEENFLQVNGQSVKSSYKVKPTDLITFSFPNPARDFVLVPQNIPIDVIYEDEEVIVVNKNNLMVVHPGCGNYDGTLVNALLYRFGKLPETDSLRPGLVHRIDKHTSGLLVVAKTEFAMHHLSEQFRNRTVERRYNALVWGRLKTDFGTINAHIGRAQFDRKLMAAYPEGDQGKHAVTHWRVLEEFGYVTLVECKLETGRTHQIRVHFKHIGHPLFNDKEYGGDRILRGDQSVSYMSFVNRLFHDLPGQALHARTLAFTHPTTGERLHFESDLPQNLQHIFDAWRKWVQQ